MDKIFVSHRHLIFSLLLPGTYVTEIHLHKLLFVNQLKSRTWVILHLDCPSVVCTSDRHCSWFIIHISTWICCFVKIGDYFHCLIRKIYILALRRQLSLLNPLSREIKREIFRPSYFSETEFTTFTKIT